MPRKKVDKGYMGDPNLRKAHAVREYTPWELSEVMKCVKDIEYFAETYCKIITLEGEEIIKLYDYQKELLHVMHNGRPEDDKYNTIVLSPRQCISNSSILNINGSPTVAIDLFNDCSSNDEVYANSMYIHSHKSEGLFIDSPDGKVEIEYVHRTIAFDAYEVRTENGLVLTCSGRHVLMNGTEEMFASESLGKTIDTAKGPSKITSVIDLLRKETMIDLSLKSDRQVYYSNGMVSHNSGKCVTGDTEIKIKKDGFVSRTTIEEFHNSL